MRLLSDAIMLNDVVGRIYDCTLRPENWQPLMAELAGMIGARRTFLGAGSRSDPNPLIVVAHNIEIDETYGRYLPINPIMPAALTWPIDKVYHVARDYGLEALRATRYYQGYLAPRGDLDALAFTLTREGDRFGHWLVITQDDRPPISDAEAAGFELLAPHVRRAVEIAGVLGARRLSAETYRAALDQLDPPVLILDHRRRVAYANPAAEAMLTTGQVLRVDAGDRVAGATEAVEQALRQALGQEVGALDQLVTGRDGEERLLFAVPLAIAREDQLGQEDRSTLLVLRSPRLETQNPIAIAARVFGLTPAQVQVLTFLAQGHTPGEIAGILGVALSTVKSHLSALYQRSGTSRQAELIARTLSFASPLGGGPSAERWPQRRPPSQT